MGKSENDDVGSLSGSWRSIDAVKTSLGILETLRKQDGAGVTEVANRNGISKSCAHSHLATLYDEEFVVKDGDEYRLSLKFIGYGEDAKQAISTYGFIQNEADKLAEQTGEAISVVIEEHGRAVFIYMAYGDAAVNTAASVGHRKHLHCSAAGKAILAQLSDERVDRIVAKHGLPAYTDNTITDREILFDELQEIRERGVSFDDEEAIIGMRCVGSALTNQQGELLGGISVSGPVSRMHDERHREEIPEMITNTANVIKVNSSNVRNS